MAQCRLQLCLGLVLGVKVTDRGGAGFKAAFLRVKRLLMHVMVVDMTFCASTNIIGTTKASITLQFGVKDYD